MKIEIGFGWVKRFFENEVVSGTLIVVTVCAIVIGIPIGLISSSVELQDIEYAISNGEPIAIYHVTITPGFIRNIFIAKQDRRLVDTGDEREHVWVDLDDLGWTRFNTFEQDCLDDFVKADKGKQILNGLEN